MGWDCPFPKSGSRFFPEFWECFFFIILLPSHSQISRLFFFHFNNDYAVFPSVHIALMLCHVAVRPGLCAFTIKAGPLALYAL